MTLFTAKLVGETSEMDDSNRVNPSKKYIPKENNLNTKTNKKRRRELNGNKIDNDILNDSAQGFPN